MFSVSILFVGRKQLKVNEEMLTPVLRIVKEESPLNTEQDVSLSSSLVEANIESIDEDVVQYEFKEGGLFTIYLNDKFQFCLLFLSFFFYSELMLHSDAFRMRGNYYLFKPE